MTNKERTVGELRLALTNGDDSETIPEALRRIAAEHGVMAQYEADAAAHARYVATRNQRQHEAVEAAARAASQGQSDGEKMARRQAARADAHAAFEAAEPLLDFQEWIDKGRPEVHVLGAAARAAAALKATIAA